MKIVIISDIYGCCAFIKDLETYFISNDFEVFVLDPYFGKYKEFKNKSEAYNSFITNCGHDSYFKLLCEKVKYIEPDFVIGFSAGGSALWRLSTIDLKNCKSLISFYPSQIYKYKELNPINLIHVIFPREEETFDVCEIKDCIDEKDKVKTTRLLFTHGFMNKSSSSYDKKGEVLGMEIINKILNKLLEQ